MKLLLILLLSLSSLFGAPAYNKLREFTQSDGTTFSAKAFGNQHLNWIESEDGKILKYNAQTKNFEYAVIKESSLKPSGVRYNKENSLRARSLGRVEKLDKDALYQLWAEKQRESASHKHH